LKVRYDQQNSSFTCALRALSASHHFALAAGGGLKRSASARRLRLNMLGRKLLTKVAHIVTRLCAWICISIAAL